MDITKYQEWTRTTAVYPKDKGLEYTTLGLAGEAGEVCNKVKKIIRDNGGIVTDDVRGKISDELGDVIYYWARLADELNLSCESILLKNVEKLNSRKERNVLKGSGDSR